MKKLFAIAAAVMLSIFSASAEEWDIFALMFTGNTPAGSAMTDIYGVKAGAPISGGTGTVYGVEGAVLWAGTKEVNGIKCSLIGTDGTSGAGLQLAIVNFIDKFAGLQLGIFNYATDSAFQIGLINIIENSPVKFMPLVNCHF